MVLTGEGGKGLGRTGKTQDRADCSRVHTLVTCSWQKPARAGAQVGLGYPGGHGSGVSS